jgi:cell division protein FtsB
MNEEELLILQVSEGNIGAETFAREAIELDHDAAVKGFRRLLGWNIPGEYFYALWNDCCERDTALAIEVMNEYPKFLIFDALDWFSHIRINLKNIKEAKKLQKKIHLKRKIRRIILIFNLCVAISSLIFAIINLFVLKGKYDDITFLIPVIIVGFCYLIILSDYINARKNLIDLMRENVEYEKLLMKVESFIELSKMEPEEKYFMKVYFFASFRKSENLRDLRWQRFARK